jgi:hypothetical protein
LIRIDFSSPANGWNNNNYKNTTTHGNAPRRRIVVEADDDLIHDHDDTTKTTTTPTTTTPTKKKEERIVYMNNHDHSRHRAGARVLEDKVARVAAKKCSVEEVTTLHKELQDWLTSEDHKVRLRKLSLDLLSRFPFVQTSSLYLSAALLRAILMNHVAHSEASKVAKVTEANLKARVDDLEITNQKLDGELRKFVLPLCLFSIIFTLSNPPPADK